MDIVQFKNKIKFKKKSQMESQNWKIHQNLKLTKWAQ